MKSWCSDGLGTARSGGHPALRAAKEESIAVGGDNLILGNRNQSQSGGKGRTIEGRRGGGKYFLCRPIKRGGTRAKIGRRARASGRHDETEGLGSRVWKSAREEEKSPADEVI